MNNIWKQLDHHEWTDVQHGRVRERLVQFMQTTRPVEQAPVRTWSWMTLPRFAMVGVAVLVLSLGGGGVVVAAAQDSAPYESLYPVRIFAETMRTKLTRNPVEKAELVLKFSEERLAEMRTLATMQAAAEGRGRAEVVVSGEKRIKAFKRNGQAMKRFAELAEKHVAQLQVTQASGETDELSAHLDAVLDASLGILLSVETNAPIDEPARAVVAKTKQEISPVESNVERVINERSVKAIELFRADDDNDKKREEDKKNPPSGGAFATARIEAVRRSMERAEELLKEAEEKYGDDAVVEMKRAFENARVRLEKAEALFKSGDYYAAFTEAGEAMRIATHLKVYLPIMEKRAKVFVDDQEQLKLYILPKYLDDLKPTPVTGTVSGETTTSATSSIIPTKTK